MFKVGDIITGKLDNGYGYTTEEALMLVTKLRNRNEEEDMYVTILFCDYSSYIDTSWWVDNSEEKFEYTTFEEFEANHTRCKKMNRRYLNSLLSKYGLKYEKPKRELSPNAYVLSDEMRKELIEEMKTLLTTYHYHPTDEGLNEILIEWCNNKADLIHMFEKHPNYNGKFQIVFDYDYIREFDQEAINKFRKWLQSDEVQNMYKKEVILGEHPYNEVYLEHRRLKQIVYFFDSCSDIETINGICKSEYLSKYNLYANLKDEYECSDDVYIDWDDRIAYEKELYDIKNRIDDVCAVLRCTIRSQLLGREFADFLNNHIKGVKVTERQKLSRVINKILCHLGVDKAPNYNKEYAKFADAINPLKIKRHTVISVHPIDYYTMSFGNSWSSCHTIDKKNDRGIDGNNNYRGCNSSGTESYMLDNTSCVFYTVDAAYDGNQLELENKINRCMFHYYDSQLAQGRIYPQTNDSGSNDLYKDIREIGQKVFADMLGVPNYWTNKKGTSACCEAISSYGTHYRDYGRFGNCNVSTLKDSGEHEVIKVGHNPICPCCGEEHDRDSNVECSYCNEED